MDLLQNINQQEVVTNEAQHYQSMELWLEKAKELYNVKKELKQLQQIEKQLSADLQKYQLNEEMAYENMRYYYEESRGSIDYSLIPELKNVDLEFYRKEPVRRWKIEILSI